MRFNVVYSVGCKRHELDVWNAGFETTGFTIETAVYHLLATPSLLHRLKQELAEAFSNERDMPHLAILENLPYLKAVVQESLRLSVGVMARLPRINRKGAMVYGEWVIPKDTLVSMSQKDILLNAGIFQNPNRFDPERWMEGEESVRLSKHLVTFSKGARRCLGMNLAHAELYYAIAMMVRRFDLALFETKRQDVDAQLDFFVPKPDSRNGVRVLVH